MLSKISQVQKNKCQCSQSYVGAKKIFELTEAENRIVGTDTGKGRGRGDWGEVGYWIQNYS